MKKLALALMAISASIFGITALAVDYPPANNAAVVTTPGPGQPFTVTVGCTPPGDVVFTFEGVVQTKPCVAASGGAVALLATPAGGSASATFTAPTAPGTYTGTYIGAGTNGNWTITILGTATTTVAPTVTTVAPTVTTAAPVAPTGGLPATGSNGTSTMTILAIGLFAVGAGLFGVSQVRRRSAA